MKVSQFQNQQEDDDEDYNSDEESISQISDEIDQN